MTACECADRAIGAVKKSLLSAKESFMLGFNEGNIKGAGAPPLHPARRIETPEERLSPVLKEMRAICDISGLTGAIDEMRAIGLKHAGDPVAARAIRRLESLSLPEQELLSRRLLARLGEDPFIRGAMDASPIVHAEMSEEDCRRMSGAFLRCTAESLEDAGLTREECDKLFRLSEEMSRPLNDLAQLYLQPKTLAQKIKRAWRMPRILFKTVKIIRNAQALALPPAEPPSITIANKEIPWDGPVH